MAQQDYSGILIAAGIGAVAWYGYQQGWFSSLFPATVAAAPATTTGVPAVTTSNPPAPTTVMTPPIITVTNPAPPELPPSTTPAAPSTSGASPAQSVAALQMMGAAGTTGTLNADQWQYYWNQLGFTPIPGADYTAAFFPNGRPANTASYTPYSALQFVVAIDTQGLAGIGNFGNYGGIPAASIHGGW